MKRILLTGGTGFVGANLARRLLRDGHEVHLLLRSQSNCWRIDEILCHIRTHTAELCSAPSMIRVLREVKPDWVFHLAVHGAYSWQESWSEMVRTNVVGTSTLVDACVRVGIEAFVNTGSSSEYGFQDHAMSEDELPQPNSQYALTKLTATQYCQWAARTHGVRMPTLRLYSVYGPFEDPRRLLPTLVREGLRGRLPRLANPNVARDFVEVEDVIDAYLLAAQHPRVEHAGIYNIGTGVQTHLYEIVEVARQTMNISEEPIWGSMDNRAWDSNIWVASPDKIQAQLGWRPATNLKQGFAALVGWHRARQSKAAA